MLSLFDLGKISFNGDQEQFRAEIANICRRYLTLLYSTLRDEGVVEGSLRYEYDVNNFNKEKISKEDLIQIIQTIYIDSPTSFLYAIDSFCNFAFKSNKIIEFGDESLREIEYIPSAEGLYFSSRAREIVNKALDDFKKYCDVFYDKEEK